MSKSLQHFQRLMDLSIEGAIDSFRRGGYSKQSLTIKVRDLDVQRVTLRLRANVVQYGKSIKVRLHYSAVDRAFHFTLDLDEVVMTPSQAKKYTGLLMARREVA